jgi:hypothetical protein
MEKMHVFISWSGPRSRAVAEALRDYLPIIVNAFTPWLSCADIDKGARWISELSEALATARASIVCLTPGNLNAPYILFEAGALSKTVGKTHVCTLLIGMEPIDMSGPLSQFQATRTTKDELLQLMKSLNKALGETVAVREQQLETTFDLCWPKLKERLHNVPDDGSTNRPERDQREVLEDLVETVRSIEKDTARRITQLKHEVELTSMRLVEQFTTTQTLVSAALQNPPPNTAFRSGSWGSSAFPGLSDAQYIDLEKLKGGPSSDKNTPSIRIRGAFDKVSSNRSSENQGESQEDETDKI